MKYVVLYTAKREIHTSKPNAFNPKVPTFTTVTIRVTAHEEFENKEDAVSFCKANNGIIVRGLDLVLESENEN